jgi:hypothetical protein
MDWPARPVSLRRHCGIGTVPGFIYARDRRGPPAGRRNLVKILQVMASLSIEI